MNRYVRRLAEGLAEWEHFHKKDLLLCMEKPSAPNPDREFSQIDQIFLPGLLAQSVYT